MFSCAFQIFQYFFSYFAYRTSHHLGLQKPWQTHSRWLRLHGLY
jgi:hypothetical protein